MKTKLIIKRMIFMLCLTALAMAPSRLVAENFELGDLNYDGSVNVTDVTLLINRILNGCWPHDSLAEVFVVNGVAVRMVVVESGTFMMGSNAWENQSPPHQVTLSGYRIGQTEVTQALWMAVMGNNPSNYCHEGTYNRPVECVSWEDCQRFITRLNELTGENFRLPTEAEWEFAARGGNLSRGYSYSGSNNVGEVAWYSGNATRQRPYTVATKAPNELGIYDMSGNVAEWVNDWYDLYDLDATPQTNPTGPETGYWRITRGGNWGTEAGPCSVASRLNRVSGASKYIGFRLAL